MDLFFSVKVKIFIDRSFFFIIFQLQNLIGNISIYENKFFNRKEVVTMTSSQKSKCEDIINAATVAAGATGLAPIPGSDAGPLLAIQVTMIVALADVFNLAFSKAYAWNLAKTQLAEQGGKYVAGQIAGIIPVVGTIAKGSVAAGFTRALGWSVAEDFALQSQNR